MIEVVGLDQITSLVDHRTAGDAVRAGLERLAAGHVIAPDEMAIDLEPGDVHVKGAHLIGERWIVFKVASGSFPGASNAGCSFVVDAATGVPAMVLDDGGWLTEMRTAAAGALVTDLLANPGPLTVAVIGTGVQSGFQIDALRARREVREVRMWGRNADRAGARAASHGAIVYAEIADAVRGADVVITATSATEPVLDADLVEPGMHITALGSDAIGKHELDVRILARASTVVADDVTTCARVGELQHASAHVGRATPFTLLVAGMAPGRSNENDITVADLCGIGTYDAAIAGLVADRLASDRA